MLNFRCWMRPWAVTTLAGVAAACGCSEDKQSGMHPDGGERVDAAPDGAPPMRGSGGGGGLGGSGGASTGGALGTGCTFTADAATDPPVVPPSDGGARDGSVRDGAAGPHLDAASRDAVAPSRDATARDAAGIRDASTQVDGGGKPVGYPPLEFSKIGKPKTVDSQFLFTEGPVWDPAAQALFFTDINADAIYRLTLPSTFEVAFDHVGNADGLALDPAGNLIGAGFVARDIWRQSGSKTLPLASEYRGRKLNSPDDLVARSDGVIYFTDPLFGIDGSQGFTAQAAELCYQGVYRLTTSGVLHLEDESTVGPNGVNFSPDEQTLYVSYTNTGDVASFDVAPDGSLQRKKVIANVPLADSMCVDAGGNIYVASLAGITVLDPSGAHLGVIPTTGQVPTNCAFGGPDQRAFFITARIALVGTPTKGNSALWRIDDMPIPGIPGTP